MIVALAVVSGARAVPTALSDVVPADVVAAFLADSMKDRQRPSGTGSPLGLATFVIDQAYDLGLLSGLDTGCRAWFDALASLSVILEHPHALALFDVHAAALDDGGHRLAGMHAAVIMHTRGHNSAIEGRIQHLLNIYTNSTESTLTTERGKGGVVFTLRDRRLPEWAVVRWGPIGEEYVVAVGQGSFRRIEHVLADRSQSLTTDAWFGDAFKAAGGPSAAFALYVRPGRLYVDTDERFAEKVDRVREAMVGQDVERGLWTVEYADRAVEAKGFLRRNGKDELRPLTTHNLAGMPEDRIIPDAANGYAILDLEPQTLCDTVCAAYLAARSPGTRQRLRAYWRDLQAEAGVSIADDIIAHLGRGAAIHDCPQHALHLPLAWTIVMPVRSDPATLRKNINRLAGVWRRQLEETGPVRLRMDEDGLWYLFFGINGPAVGVSDQWLVVSFSPSAVRQNLAHLANHEPLTAAEPSPVGRVSP